MNKIPDNDIVRCNVLSNEVYRIIENMITYKFANITSESFVEQLSLPEQFIYIIIEIFLCLIKQIIGLLRVLSINFIL